MIRLNLPDIPTTDRLIEALYVAAGQRPDTAQAAEWRRLACELENALDSLGPQPLQPVTTPTRRTPVTDTPHAATLPQITVPCPRCNAPAGHLCTSHGGTRPRRNDVHQARTDAYEAAHATSATREDTAA